MTLKKKSMILPTGKELIQILPKILQNEINKVKDQILQVQLKEIF